MSFFISDAIAEQGAATAASPGIEAFLFPIGLVVLFYFFLIRPQSKRHKQHKEMIDGLQKGEEVVTSGGVLGKITDLGENFVSLEISKEVTIHVQKHAITNVMPKGTIKDL